MQRTNDRKETERSGTRIVNGAPIQNEILNSLPESELNLIQAELEAVELPARMILHEAGEKIQHAYFINQGMASLVVLTSDGRSVEIAIVGPEGMVGTPLAVGLHRGPYRGMMQIPGRGFRLRSEVLDGIRLKAPQFGLLLSRFVLVQGLQIAQIAACNRLHEIEQRLARWLLMCQDRVASETLPITHEFLAQMLGTGRPSVSLAAGTLQKSGIIETSRGSVRILNRADLEGSACECYRAIQQFKHSVSADGEG